MSFGTFLRHGFTNLQFFVEADAFNGNVQPRQILFDHFCDLVRFGLRECVRTIGEANLEQAREIADALKYKMTAGAVRDGLISARFLQIGLRPALRVISGA